MFALAKMKYSNTFKGAFCLILFNLSHKLCDFQGDVHFKMLRSIFVRLSKGQHKMHVARTGGHWVDIGFQVAFVCLSRLNLLCVQCHIPQHVVRIMNLISYTLNLYAEHVLIIILFNVEVFTGQRPLN